MLSAVDRRHRAGRIWRVSVVVRVARGGWVRVDGAAAVAVVADVHAHRAEQLSRVQLRGGG